MKAFLPFLLVVCASSVFANSASAVSACGTASLDTYESDYQFPTSSGCAIGVLDYSSFNYHAISNAPTASDIILSPSSSSQGFFITQAGGAPFTASAGEKVQFEIDYNILIDPAPVIHGSSLILDPPSGNVSITEYFCNDTQYFYQGACFGAPVDTLHVGTPVTGYPYSANINFSNPAQVFEEVGILFTLDGTNGPSSFDGVGTGTSLTLVPEPGSVLLVGTLLLGGFTIKRKLRG